MSRPTAVPSAALTLTSGARRRITAALFAGQGVFSAANVAGFTVMSIVATELSGQTVMAGVPGALFLLGRAASGYPAGWLMDLIGRRWPLALGYLLGTVGAGLATLSIAWHSLGGFLVGAVLVGMARGASDQARFAAAEIHEPARRGRVIGLIVAAGIVGAIGGPLLIAASSELAVDLGAERFAGPWAAATVLIALALLVTIGLVKPDPRNVARAMERSAPRTRESAARDRPARPLRAIFASGHVRLAVAAMLVGQAVMSMVMIITPLHMHQIHQGTGAISVAMSVHMLGMFGLASLTGRATDRLGPRPVIALGALQLVTASLLTPFAQGMEIILPLMFLLGYGWNCCFIAGSALLSVGLSAGEHGRTQGLNETMVGLAAGLGGLGTGPVFAVGGMVWIGAASLAASLALVAALGWPRIVRRPLAV